MSRLLIYLFYRNSRLLLLIGAIIVALGLGLGLLGTKQIDVADCSLSDCLTDSTELVYLADWNKNLIVLGPSDSATYYIIYPSRFSPSLDRATFKTNTSISLTDVAFRVDSTNLGFTLRDHNGDSSHTGFIVENLSWKDASGLDHTSTTDQYQTDPNGNPIGIQEFQYDWSAGLPWDYAASLFFVGYVFLRILEAKKVIPSRPARKRTSNSSGRARPDDA